VKRRFSVFKFLFASQELRIPGFILRDFDYNLPAILQMKSILTRVNAIN